MQTELSCHAVTGTDDDNIYRSKHVALNDVYLAVLTLFTS